MPAQRFAPAAVEDRSLLELWLPPTLVATPKVTAVAAADDDDQARSEVVAVSAAWTGGPVEFDRVVPPSGNMIVTQRQFWMGAHRAGRVARIWADADLIHVLIGGPGIKTVRSHLSVNDLAKLVAAARPTPVRWSVTEGPTVQAAAAEDSPSTTVTMVSAFWAQAVMEMSTTSSATPAASKARAVRIHAR